MKEKRAKIHKLKNAPKPYQFIGADMALSTPSGSEDVFKFLPDPVGCGNRHKELDLEWCYSVWIQKMRWGMTHLKIDGIGETFLMPEDNWQDIMAAFIGRKDL